MGIATEPLPLRTLKVHGRTMAYAETGAGRPILFQHGNPTSSYLWRNVMRPLAGAGRCIAVDLIGMGGSDKLPDSGPGRYAIAEHARHLDAAWDRLVPEGKVVLVLHDWGSALGFDWARRHPDRVAGIVYMEAIVRPIPSWDDWPEAARGIFQKLRSPDGEAMVLDKNVFVERILPASVLRELSEAEMAHYRAPFAEPGEGRRPTLDFPRQIPIAGEPPEIAEMAASYARFLETSDIPKLFVDADPGSILTGPQRAACLGWPAQEVVRVAGSHFIQEDSPDEIAAAVAAFLAKLPQ